MTKVPMLVDERVAAYEGDREGMRTIRMPGCRIPINVIYVGIEAEMKPEYMRIFWQQVNEYLQPCRARGENADLSFEALVEAGCQIEAEGVPYEDSDKVVSEALEDIVMYLDSVREGYGDVFKGLYDEKSGRRIACELGYGRTKMNSKIIPEVRKLAERYYLRYYS